MLEILLPANCKQEADWVCSVLFGEFLGLDYATSQSGNSGFCIQHEGRRLELPDVFFAGAAQAWLEPPSLPSLPFMKWETADSGLDVRLVSQPLPVLFGSPGAALGERHVQLELDIFGSVFFLLSCYEEAVQSDRDSHDRFPATASSAYQEGFLDRPLVNEYLEVLWAAMKHLWPGLQRKSRDARTLVSCDVDEPYSSRSLLRTVKSAGGDVLRRNLPRLAIQRFLNYVASRLGNTRFDPLNTFDWIMDVNEMAGNQVAFYFIADHSGGDIDGCYHMDESYIRKLMRHMHGRGHEIGLHGSYNSYKDSAQTMKEVRRLRCVMESEGIQQDEVGCRQHFLRWATPKTASNLEAAGIAYDATLTFADCPGFRCGTCYEYSLFDVVQRRPLKLRERPLVVMECSVIAERYMGLGYSDEALESMLAYKRTCRRFDGDFTLLWHNSHFIYDKDKQFYKELIA